MTRAPHRTDDHAQPWAVEVLREAERDAGWEYVVRVTEGAAQHDHVIRLAWVDHDHWSGGAKPPSETVRAVVEAVVVTLGTRDLPRAFDAATARRWVPDLDSLVRARL